METKIYKSFAKINLGLEILFRRYDNFHEINSVFVPIDLYDELTISFADSFSFEQLPKDISIPIKDNIVYKTLMIMKNKYKINISNLSIKLVKKIPIGAGLGGGSSNSAATIKAVNELFDLKLSLQEQSLLASEIGSDVPFFIYNKLAIVRGRGDKLRTLDINLPFKFLIVFPNIHISTKIAYSWINITNSKNPTDYQKALLEVIINPSILPKLFKNDFEEFLFSRFPILKEIKQVLTNKGAIFSSISGSGSSIFGIFPIESDLPDLSTELQGIKQFHCFQVK